MKKTLVNKIVAPTVVLGSLVLTGCAGVGAVLMGSDDPGAKALGTIMYTEGLHDQRMKEAKEGKTEVNLYSGEKKYLEDEEIINEVIDLKTGETEIEVVGLLKGREYLLSKAAKGLFSKGGYLILHKDLTGRLLGKIKFDGSEIENDMIWLIRNGKHSCGGLLSHYKNQ